VRSLIVCSCNVLSDCQIRSTVEPAAGGARTPGQVYRCLGCSPQCGRCARTIKAILDKAIGACAAVDHAGCGGCPAQPLTHAEALFAEFDPAIIAARAEHAHG
jgi:bacterioferritin-associated ferredoxin